MVFSHGKMSRPEELYRALSALVLDMPPGAKMPSYKDLSQRWKVIQRSIDMAYAQLEEQGVLTRRWGTGTFVEDPLAGGTFVYITGSHLLRSEEGASTRLWFIALEALIRERCPRATIEMLVTLDDPATANKGRGSELSKRIPLLCRQTRLLGAFTAYWLADSALATIRDLGLPVVGITHGTTPNNVWLASPVDICMAGLRHLIDEGWTDIAVIGRWAAKSVLPESLERLASTTPSLKSLRLRTYAPPEDPDDLDWRRFEARWMGVSQQLLNDPSPPDALLVLDDVICRSVLLGAQLAGVNLPERFAMVTASNEDLPIYASRELTRIEFSAKAIAAEALRIMMALLQGHENQGQKTLMPTLIAGASSRKVNYAR
jgi:hypothetical protein